MSIHRGRNERSIACISMQWKWCLIMTIYLTRFKANKETSKPHHLTCLSFLERWDHKCPDLLNGLLHWLMVNRPFGDGGVSKVRPVEKRQVIEWVCAKEISYPGFLSVIAQLFGWHTWSVSTTPFPHEELKSLKHSRTNPFSLDFGEEGLGILPQCQKGNWHNSV